MAGRRALVIGNADYVEPRNKLSNPCNDAAAIGEKLRGLHFDVTIHTDLICDEMENVLYRFEEGIRDCDASVFYFAGHGLQVRGENYLVPIDAIISSEMHLRRRTFSLTEILNAMERRARNSLLFIDACRNNGFASSLQAGDAELTRDMSQGGLADLRPHLNRSSFIAFATAPNTVAYDGEGGHSPFTQALLDHIATPNLSISDMMIEVRRSVRKTTSDRQTPWDQSALQERFFFNTGPDGQAARPKSRAERTKESGRKLFNMRPNDLFMPFSRADSARIEPLVHWLRNVAGLEIAAEAGPLPAIDRADELRTRFAGARAALLPLSRNWAGSPSCKDEIAGALEQQQIDRRYRVIALKLEDCETPDLLRDTSVLDMRSLDAESASALVDALVPEPAIWLQGNRDVYFSCSWRAADLGQADAIRSALILEHGFRLIGDSPDRKEFDEATRLNHIIRSCGALVAVFPFRDDTANGFTSKFMSKEVQIARDLGRPYLLFADDRVKLPAELTDAAIGAKVFPIPRDSDDSSLADRLDDFDERYRASPRPAYAFFATSLLRDKPETNRAIAIIERVTAMRCLVGHGLDGQHAQKEIIQRIRDAEFVLADVSDNDHNSLIEAGIARGAGTQLELISRPPGDGKLNARFMLRDLEVNWYADPLERIGIVHRIARKYRRRVIHPRGD